jgi:hypothetical protein
MRIKRVIEFRISVFMRWILSFFLSFSRWMFLYRFVFVVSETGKRTPPD